MKSWICALLLAATAASQANEATEVEPAVRTSTAASEPAAPAGAPQAAAGHAAAPSAAATAVPAPAVNAPSVARHAAGTAPAAGATNRASTRSGAKAHDQIDLDATQITGNRELPNVMYVVPWKKPDLGDFAGRPPKSLLDELLTPVDRDVFRRQNRYFAALHPDAAAAPAAPAPAPAPGAAATLPAGDEK